MIDLREIHPLTDFQRNAKDYAKRMKETQTPVVLTVNGKAQFVVQDASAYQKLLDRLEYAETVAALKKGLDEVSRGEEIPAEEVFEELRRKHGIPN